MFSSSAEAPGEQGLDLIHEKIRALPANVKSPHIGWNQLRPLRKSILLRAIPDDAYFYFAHSYAAAANEPHTAAACDHGFPFAAVVEHDNLMAVQFHPEKSGEAGSRVLAQFSGVGAMTLARRIIPCLDVDAGRVVKGVEFAGLRDMGDPEELAARYNREGADELILLDITASRDGRATFLETVRRVAQQLNIPFTAGGGIRRLEDGHAVLRAGADKVTVNTAAVERPELISELAAQFGSQAVVLSMDVKKTDAGWEVFTRGGAESSGRDAGGLGA